jgi:uncharacterized protein (TIRG00374 family)
MRQSTKTALSLAVAALLLYVSFRKLDPGEIWASLSQASPWLLFLAALVNILHYLVRAVRWRQMLQHFKVGIRFLSLLTTTFVGFLVSWVFPGRLGEFVRPFLLGRKEGIPVSGAVSTVVLERILDAGTVLLLFAGALLLTPAGVITSASRSTMDPLLRSGRFLGLGVLFLLAGLSLLFLYRERLFGFLESRYPARKGLRATLLRWGREFVEGCHVLAAPRALAMVLLYSIGTWLVIGLSSWLVLRAFHLEVPLTGIFLFLPLSVIGIAVPTPGGIGSFEFFCSWGLENLFGTPAPEAMAAAVSLHMVSLLPVALFGPISVWQEGVSLGGIVRDSRQGLTRSPGREEPVR